MSQKDQRRRVCMSDLKYRPKVWGKKIAWAITQPLQGSQMSEELICFCQIFPTHRFLFLQEHSAYKWIHLHNNNNSLDFGHWEKKRKYSVEKENKHLYDRRTLKGNRAQVSLTFSFSET